MAPNAYVFAERAGAGADPPALFLFHGTGGDEHQFLDLGAELRPGARLIAPRGDVSEGGALRYFRRLAEGQYDMEDLARATAGMAGFVGERLGPDRLPEVAGMGYSNGANILAAMLFAHPGLFDTPLLLHPLIPFEPAPQPGLAGRRILITAGRRDPICPPPAAEALAGYFRRQGAEVELVWHEGGHEIRREELLAAQRFLAGRP